MPSWMEDDLNERRQRGLERRRHRLRTPQQLRVRIGGRDYLNFASNDYLNLAHEPRLAHAAAKAARTFGCGAGASPLIAGYLSPHRALERTLAEWEGTEAALTFSSGYAANVAVLSSLSSRGDAVFSDELNHASLIDGCRLGRGNIHVYRHVDMEHLESLLKQHGPPARRRIIVTDTVFSMDGTLAPLRQLIAVAERFDAVLVIDEAHATGVLGERGTGATELLTPAERGDPDRLIKIGTLSKALGTQGGFVCGSARLIRWLVNLARPYIFSTALAPPIAAAARVAVGIARDALEQRRHLRDLGELLQRLVSGVNYPATHASSPIIPIIVGDAAQAMRVSARLRKHGLLVPAIRPPTVPEGTSRLRVSLTAGHTESDVRQLVDVLREQRG